MHALTDYTVPITEVTPEMVDELVNGAYTKGNHLYNEHYLDVRASCGVEFSVTVYVTEDGDCHWHVLD